jgi:hypothetical protein
VLGNLSASLSSGELPNPPDHPMRRASDKLEAQIAADLAAANVPVFVQADPAATTAAQVKFVLDLLSEIRRMIEATEDRITATIKLRSTFDDERWTKQESRIARVERTLGEASDRIGAHITAATLADATIDARLQPARYVLTHWRTALLVVLALLGLVGLTVDLAGLRP